MKTRKPKRPSYVNPRSSFAGIEERLSLASLAFSQTTQRGSVYVHRVRFLGKKEGWEVNFSWIDAFAHINFEAAGVNREIALGIEGARLRWWEAQQPPTGELLEILTKLQAKKVA